MRFERDLPDRERVTVVLNVSAVVFFGVLLVVLVRRREATGFTVCVAVAFGFLLASSSAASAVRDVMAAALTALAPR
ncbi:hypothetical protein PUR71_03090 [Streptomyces sp. SP17BM10]|uniref:hypothetical protein n=1 Tax=Streptomyces sp. SP17BM10 TaxID=3002530 RepID=UPI002E781807|nr:hypothetical protein [Streptomyces sp. SP17BM10]MEE1781920.1 hypothetical protein [Streptomyces sp. SP17BM10]